MTVLKEMTKHPLNREVEGYTDQESYDQIYDLFPSSARLRIEDDIWESVRAPLLSVMFAVFALRAR